MYQFFCCYICVIFSISEEQTGSGQRFWLIGTWDMLVRPSNKGYFNVDVECQWTTLVRNNTHSRNDLPAIIIYFDCDYTYTGKCMHMTTYLHSDEFLFTRTSHGCLDFDHRTTARHRTEALAHQ